MDYLIGYCFFDSQDELEKWQLDNENHIVCNLQPHAKTMEFKNDGRNSPGMNSGITWGVFVTYKYPNKNHS